MERAYPWYLVLLNLPSFVNALDHVSESKLQVKGFSNIHMCSFSSLLLLHLKKGQAVRIWDMGNKKERLQNKKSSNISVSLQQACDVVSISLCK